MIKDQKRYIKIYMGFAIILAVASRFEFIHEGVRNVLLSVYMPMIFAAYGLFLVNDKEALSDKYVKNIFKATIVPYLWFSLFYMLKDAIYIFTGVIAQVDRKAVLYKDMTETFTFYGSSILGYLPALFLGAALYIFARKKFGYVITLIVTLVFVGLTVWLTYDAEALARLTDGDKPVLTMIFYVCWRSILAAFFMAIGEGAGNIAESQENNKIRLVILGTIVLCLGTLVLYYNGQADIESIKFGTWYMFFTGILLFILGMIMIACWIGQAPIFEFLGENAKIIYLTFIDFLIIKLSTEIIDGTVLKIFENYFFAHAVGLVAFVLLELLVVIIINRFLYFTVDKEVNKTFGMISRDE